eukprot:2669279-Prymnesium_polylepis.1
MPLPAGPAQSARPPADGDQRHRVPGDQRGSGSTAMAGTPKRLVYTVPLHPLRVYPKPAPGKAVTAVLYGFRTGV